MDTSSPLINLYFQVRMLLHHQSDVPTKISGARLDLEPERCELGLSLVDIIGFNHQYTLCNFNCSLSSSMPMI